MNIDQFLQQSGMENAPDISLEAIFLSLGMALLLSGLMFITFKKSHSLIVYDVKFNITLIMLALVTTLIMSIIRHNVALSLGMMGSLSIVRFRTNTKDPRDLGFVLWSMAIGVICSTQTFGIGIIGSIMISILMIATGDNSEKSENLLLVVRGSQSNVTVLSDIIMKYNSASKLKAQNLLEDSFELVYEIKGNSRSHEELILAMKLKEIPGVDTVNLLTPSSEII